MPSLSKEQVEYIAELARLALTEEEKELYQHQLSAILDYAARLQKLNTDDIPPTASVLPITSVMRPDAARPSLPRDALLANASAREGGMFRVDVVLEEE